MDIVQKIVPSLMVASIEGEGTVEDFDKDVDKLFEYLYLNNLKENINGLLIGIFYAEFGGKYIAAVPICKEILVADNIKIQTLPEIKCLSLVHEGSWKTIDKSFEKLKIYEQKNNIPFQFPVREIYLQSEGKEEDYRTEIQVPVK